MAYTNADLENVRKAIASGATSVSIEGRTVTYRTQQELIELEQLISTSLSNPTAETEVRPNTTKASFSRE